METNKVTSNVIPISQGEQILYTVEDLQAILGVGRTKAYDFVREVYETQTPFRVLKVGKLFRIPVGSFNNWIYADREVS